MAITSAVVLIEIVCRRKRYEFPYIFIPLCFLITGAAGAIIELYILKLYNQGRQDLVKQVALPLAIHYMIYIAGHQFFASQYLQTALSIPCMFSQAKLDYAARNPSQDERGFNNNEMLQEIEENKQEVDKADTLALLQKIDQITQDRKQQMKRINLGIAALNASVFLIASACCLFAIYAPKYLYVSSIVLLVFKNAILVYSIRNFQAFIASIEFTMANHKLIRVHFMNIVTYTVFYACSCIFYIISDNHRAGGLDSVAFQRSYLLFGVFIGLSGIFQVWNVLFIFYVLLQQTRTNKMESPQDAILERKVPNIVFIQNQNLFNEAWAETQRDQKLLRDNLRMRADINLKIYEALEDMVKMNENVGFEFIRLSVNQPEAEVQMWQVEEQFKEQQMQEQSPERRKQEQLDVPSPELKKNTI